MGSVPSVPLWDLWAGEQWALNEVRLKPPGSVYAGSLHTAPPEPEEVEPVEAEPPQPEPLQPKAEESAASAPKLPEPDSPYEAQMKARLAMAMRSGAWLRVLQTDHRLAGYVRSRLNNDS
jgi:hypothetical protein